MCCAGPGSRGISRIECFLVLKQGSTNGWSYSRRALLFQLPLLLARSFDFKQRTLVITSHCETFPQILRYVQPTDSSRKGVDLAVRAAPRMPIEKGPSLHGTLPSPPSPVNCSCSYLEPTQNGPHSAKISLMVIFRIFYFIFHSVGIKSLHEQNIKWICPTIVFSDLSKTIFAQQKKGFKKTLLGIHRRFWI